MQVWVPGKNGLVGSALSRALSGTPNVSTAREDVDITDLSAVLSFIKEHPDITHIVNCAAFSLVDLAESKKEEASGANVLGPENLAYGAKQIGARFIHLSTDYIFDGKPPCRPFKETDAPHPLNHYGRTKWEGENRTLKTLPSACILRTSWVFGQGGKNFVAKLLHMLLTQDEISLSNDQWGRPTYAPDLIDAIFKIWNLSGVYHYANRGETTKYLFGCLMREEAIRLKFPIRCKKIHGCPSSEFPSFCQRPSYSAFDTTKIEQHLSIRSWQEGLRDFLQSLIPSESCAQSTISS